MLDYFKIIILMQTSHGAGLPDLTVEEPGLS